MLIEIRKAGFINKGAELMLHAIIKEVKNRYPDVQFIMAPTTLAGSQPFHKLLSLGFYPKAWFWRYCIQWGIFAKLLPYKIRQMYGLILDSEVDVVLDAAGFAYSDQIGLDDIKELASSSKEWKKNDTKLILLPQAFGPFTSEKSIRYVKEFIQNADLVFPREITSYRKITEISGQLQKIKIYPDFTCLLEGKQPEHFDILENKFALIPNYRMIDKTNSEDGNLYLPFMIDCARYLKNISAKPFILIHEGEKDFLLAQQISDAVDGIKIIRETDALYIKGIIGQCDGVISSRYHGLVSALSQGVPALATGWSHKYIELFKDYDFDEGLLSVTDSKIKISQMIDYVTQIKTKESLKIKLNSHAEKQKKLSQEMWNNIFSLIDTK